MKLCFYRAIIINYFKVAISVAKLNFHWKLLEIFFLIFQIIESLKKIDRRLSKENFFWREKRDTKSENVAGDEVYWWHRVTCGSDEQRKKKKKKEKCLAWKFSLENVDGENFEAENLLKILKQFACWKKKNVSRHFNWHTTWGWS